MVDHLVDIVDDREIILHVHLETVGFDIEADDVLALGQPAEKDPEPVAYGLRPFALGDSEIGEQSVFRRLEDGRLDAKIEQVAVDGQRQRRDGIHGRRCVFTQVVDRFL